MDVMFDLLTLDEYSEEVRLNLAEQAQALGCRNLARACLTSNSPTEVFDEAHLDVLNMSYPDLANSAIGVGVIVGEMTRLIKTVGQLALAQEVEDEQ